MYNAPPIAWEMSSIYYTSYLVIVAHARWRNDLDACVSYVIREAKDTVVSRLVAGRRIRS